jgi:hypothetical protein
MTPHPTFNGVNRGDVTAEMLLDFFQDAREAGPTANRIRPKQRRNMEGAVDLICG